MANGSSSHWDFYRDSPEPYRINDIMRNSASIADLIRKTEYSEIPKIVDQLVLDQLMTAAERKQIVMSYTMDSGSKPTLDYSDAKFPRINAETSPGSQLQCPSSPQRDTTYLFPGAEDVPIRKNLLTAMIHSRLRMYILVLVLLAAVVVLGITVGFLGNNRTDTVTDDNFILFKTAPADEIAIIGNQSCIIDTTAGLNCSEDSMYLKITSIEQTNVSSMAAYNAVTFIEFNNFMDCSTLNSIFSLQNVQNIESLSFSGPGFYVNNLHENGNCNAGNFIPLPNVRIIIISNVLQFPPLSVFKADKLETVRIENFEFINEDDVAMLSAFFQLNCHTKVQLDLHNSSFVCENCKFSKLQKGCSNVGLSLSK